MQRGEWPLADVRDIEPITPLTDNPMYLGAHEGAPCKTMTDLIADADWSLKKVMNSSVVLPTTGVRKTFRNWATVGASHDRGSQPATLADTN